MRQQRIWQQKYSHTHRLASSIDEQNWIKHLRSLEQLEQWTEPTLFRLLPLRLYYLASARRSGIRYFKAAAAAAAARQIHHKRVQPNIYVSIGGFSLCAHQFERLLRHLVSTRPAVCSNRSFEAFEWFAADFRGVDDRISEQWDRFRRRRSAINSWNWRSKQFTEYIEFLLIPPAISISQAETPSVVSRLQTNQAELKTLGFISYWD